MSLVSVDNVRALVPTPLNSVDLQIIIDRVEAEITEKIGVAYNSDSPPSIAETIQGSNCYSIFTKRPIESITSVIDYSSLTDVTGTTLVNGTTFHGWLGSGEIRRLGGGQFGEKVIVTYVPKDQRDKRKTAIIDLVRLELSRTALAEEDVAQEYRYKAPKSWDAEKRKIMRRLTFHRF